MSSLNSDARPPSAADPRALSSLWARARALEASGCDEGAKRAYLELLALDPKHLEVLLRLSALCAKLGYSAAAKTALWQALHVSPGSSSAHSNLATLLCDGGEAAAARTHYEQAVRLDPGNQRAHQGLAIVLLRLGEVEAARRHGWLGYRGSAESWPFRGSGRPISILVAFSAAGGNVPIDPFIDDKTFLKWMLIPEFFDPGAALPPHDLVFNGIGDADRCGRALTVAAEALGRSSAPVLNAPERVLQTARTRNAERLGRLGGVTTPRTVELPREALAAPDAVERAGLAWPILVRSPGFHTGQHCVKVDRPEELPAAVASLPGERLLALQFIDTRGADGKFRKFRVMMVGGELYPLHLAVSARWKVHYVSADMADAAHRAEDRSFLEDMPGVLGPAVLEALRRIHAELGLDYGGLDFAVDAAGDVVVFEANATMVIVPPDPDERWSYRVAPVARVQRAVRRLLLSKAGREDASAAAQ